jgi:tripartite-type tricarboxylate transporter receptor subunit TctC
MMNLPRRKLLTLAVGVATLPFVPHIACAQNYPSRPVRIVVGFPAGGATDIGARLIGQWLSKRLGQPFIIENKPGAGTHAATESVVRAPADGHTLLMATGSNAINAALYEKMSYNFLRDMAPVAAIMRSPLVMEVHPSVPARTVPEFIAYAKANADRISMASFGTGGSGHLAGELFKIMTGLEFTHVPYRGSAPMVIDLVGGQVQGAFDNLAASIEQIKAGKLHALAVTTTMRSSALPDVPAMAELLPGFEASAWIGIAAPKDTPQDVIGLLNREINAGLADPRIKARLAELSGMIVGGSVADFENLIVAETEKWGSVIRKAHIKPE